MRDLRKKAALAVLTLSLALPAGTGAESPKEPAEASEPIAEAAGEIQADEKGPGGRRRKREVPTAMVLCRGPRGAVYARDVNEGCRNTRLDASNLVDFGAGDDCFLRKASTFDPEGKTTGKAETCNDVCSAAEKDRFCVVGVRRDKAGWMTFFSDQTFPAGDQKLRDAMVLCCEP